jgi:hypothetical protein
MLQSQSPSPRLPDLFWVYIPNEQKIYQLIIILNGDKIDQMNVCMKTMSIGNIIHIPTFSIPNVPEWDF